MFATKQEIALENALNVVENVFNKRPRVRNNGFNVTYRCPAIIGDDLDALRYVIEELEAAGFKQSVWDKGNLNYQMRKDSTVLALGVGRKGVDIYFSFL